MLTTTVLGKLATMKPAFLLRGRKALVMRTSKDRQSNSLNFRLGEEEQVTDVKIGDLFVLLHEISNSNSDNEDETHTD